MTPRMADVESRAGQTYWRPGIEAFLRELYARETEGMREAVRSIEREGLPAIQVSPTDGRILEMLLRLVGARRVVEIGTLAGYSAQWIARALPGDGHLWTIEADRRHAQVARRVLEEAGLGQQVSVLEGPALEVLPTLEAQGPFDAVFVDADKENYDRYGAWAQEHLRVGGLLVGDNAYLFGQLAGYEPQSVNEEAQIASMRAFHRRLAEGFEAVCLPTADGLAIGIKRG